MKRVAGAIATWFGCGLFPVAPGTVGSAAAVAMAWAVNHYWPYRPLWLSVAAVLLLLPGIWAADVTARSSGRKDPGLVVVDEVIGQWIALSGATVLNTRSWWLGFALFRIFDIWKPFPIRRLEALPGGRGIVADDVLAGVYGALVLFLAGWFNLY